MYIWFLQIIHFKNITRKCVLILLPLVSGRNLSKYSINLFTLNSITKFFNLGKKITRNNKIHFTFKKKSNFARMK